MYGQTTREHQAGGHGDRWGGEIKTWRPALRPESEHNKELF